MKTFEVVMDAGQGRVTTITMKGITFKFDPDTNLARFYDEDDHISALARNVLAVRPKPRRREKVAE